MVEHVDYRAGGRFPLAPSRPTRINAVMIAAPATMPLDIARRGVVEGSELDQGKVAIGLLTILLIAHVEAAEDRPAEDVSIALTPDVLEALDQARIGLADLAIEGIRP